MTIINKRIIYIIFIAIILIAAAGGICYGTESQTATATTNNNSQTTAQQGAINITTGANTEISGANLKAQQIKALYSFQQHLTFLPWSVLQRFQQNQQGYPQSEEQFHIPYV